MGAEAAIKATPVHVEGHAIKVPSVLTCELLIVGLKAALTIRGLGWTLRWIRRRVELVTETVSVDFDALRAVEQAVAMAGALYPGRALCLEQSLALYYLLRRQGVGVKYHQGVQPHPFLAHAWVEFCGEPLNDVLEHVERFARLPDQLP